MAQRFYLPTEVITGCGSLQQLGAITARLGTRALLVCGQRALRASGVLDRALASLANAGVRATVYDGVRGEATLSMVSRALELLAAERCQVVIGVGGGSAIDAAKAAAGLSGLPGTPHDYFGGRAIEHAGLPLVTVPTTAGTGAEVTKNAVLIDEETGIKNSIRDDAWFARVAIVDAETTLSTSPEVTAHSGADALCQAIEAYTSIGASPITDGLAMRAIQLIGQALEEAYSHGQNLAAREAMSMGSLLAGMAFGSAGLGGVHGMAHPLGARYAIPHGLVCGLLLPYTMQYNLAYATAKYAQVASLLGESTDHLAPAKAAERAVAWVRDLLCRVDISEHLAPLGVQRADFEWIIAKSLPSGSLKSNPRPLAAEDVRAILEAAM